jgi:hypothetical protein
MGDLYVLAGLAFPILLLAIAAAAGRWMKAGRTGWVVSAAIFVFLFAASIPAMIWLWNRSCDYAADKCV